MDQWFTSDTDTPEQSGILFTCGDVDLGSRMHSLKRIPDCDIPDAVLMPVNILFLQDMIF